MWRIVALCVSVGLVSSQVPIPKRPLGYVYNHGDLGAPVHLDVFMGPVCPDSRAAFPTLEKVADFYKDKVILTLFEFPLPYHHNSFMGAMVSMHFTNILNSKRSIEHCMIVINTTKPGSWNDFKSVLLVIKYSDLNIHSI
jgi:thiol-disulfide isomerase/thioredoxin